MAVLMGWLGNITMFCCSGQPQENIAYTHFYVGTFFLWDSQHKVLLWAIKSHISNQTNLALALIYFISTKILMMILRLR